MILSKNVVYWIGDWRHKNGFKHDESQGKFNTNFQDVLTKLYIGMYHNIPKNLYLFWC